MAVNTALANPSSFPSSTRIASVGTAWQAVAPPSGPGPGQDLAWTITADTAFYVDFGAAADDAGSVSTHARSAHSANVEVSYPIPREVGRRAHLLIAAQTGTANFTIRVLR